MSHFIVTETPHDERFFHAKSFEHLLYDSINLLYLAHDVDREADDNDVERACSRSSIVNALLLFECAANCCLSALPLPARLAEDLDKLPFLSKLELFASHQEGATRLDRGRSEVAAAMELKALRDGYVHPKVIRRPLAEIAPGHYEVESKKTGHLKLPRSPSGWRRDSAVVVSRAADDFFSYYFLEVCRLSPDTVCSLLLSSSPTQIPANTSTFVDFIGGLDRAIKEWGLAFAYLGKQV